MALYIPQSILHLARSLYVRPETYGPTYVSPLIIKDCLITSIWICHKGWRIPSSQTLHMMCGEDRRLPTISAQNNEWNRWSWHMCSCRNVHPFCIPSQHWYYFTVSCSLINIWYISMWSIKMLISHIKKFTFHSWGFLEYVILLIIPLWIFWEIEELISSHKRWHSTVSVVFQIVSCLTRSWLGMLFSPVYTNVLQSGKIY